MAMIVNAGFTIRELSAVITVLIVDDHQILREGLCAMLNEDHTIKVVGDAKDGDEGVAQALKLKPDVVLMDIQMPLVNGIAAASQLKTQLPTAKVIMLSMYSNNAYIIGAIRAGAVGFILKDSSKELLTETIKNVYAGHVMIKSDILRLALNGLVSNSKQHYLPSDQGLVSQLLTERETEVLEQVMEGQTNRRIGDSLCITEATVKKHIRSIVIKLDAHDRTHAVVKAIRAGIIN
jgi:DNA-binding NarL/FixJ family response regulator